MSTCVGLDILAEPACRSPQDPATWSRCQGRSAPARRPSPARWSRRLGGEGEVPSPTFALMQRYETPRLTVTHCDFYRLEPSELGELGLDDALAEGVVLSNGPSALRDWLPEDRLDIAMDETATPNVRRVVMTGHGSWAARLARLRALSDFLDKTPYADAAARLSARRRLDALLCAARAAAPAAPS